MSGNRVRGSRAGQGGPCSAARAPQRRAAGGRVRRRRRNRETSRKQRNEARASCRWRCEWPARKTTRKACGGQSRRPWQRDHLRTLWGGGGGDGGGDLGVTAGQERASRKETRGLFNGNALLVFLGRPFVLTFHFELTLDLEKRWDNRRQSPRTPPPPGCSASHDRRGSEVSAQRRCAASTGEKPATERSPASARAAGNRPQSDSSRSRQRETRLPGRGSRSPILGSLPIRGRPRSPVWAAFISRYLPQPAGSSTSAAFRPNSGGPTRGPRGGTVNWQHRKHSRLLAAPETSKTCFYRVLEIT